MSNTVIEVRNVVDAYIYQIATTLQQNLSEQQAVAVIHHGVWTNDAGMITGYMSCYPHGNPAEESIDALIDFTIADGEAHYAVHICWSDGSTIEDLREGEITYRGLRELLGKVTEICVLAESELKTRLPNLIGTSKNDLPDH